MLNQYSEKLVQGVDLSGRQEEVWDILRRQTALYSIGDSRALPADLVQDLVRSICYCIDLHCKQGGNVPQARPLTALFGEGQRAIWRLVEEGREALESAFQVAPQVGNAAYSATLAEIEGFFRKYDMRFFAHHIPCEFTYPLHLSVPQEMEGIVHVNEYLRRLSIENRFCRYFEPYKITCLLRTIHPDYQNARINLFGPVFANVAGLAVLGQNVEALTISRDQCGKLFEVFRTGVAGEGLDMAMERLYTQLHLWDFSTREYLEESWANLVEAASQIPGERFSDLFVTIDYKR